MVADPTTFRVLPWAPTTGWLLCDLYFSDGRPVPFATRHLYRKVLDQLGSRGYDFVAGLEVEFHLFRLEDAHMAPEDAGQPGRPPSVSLLSHGYQYLTEQRYDQMEPALEIIRRDVLALGLPLRSVEVEFGPSQCEFTFAPARGLTPADNMVLFRSAVKQIARRHGFHATFMCRPKLPNVFASGWHLHQSIISRANGENAFMVKDGGEAAPDAELSVERLKDAEVVDGGEDGGGFGSQEEVAVSTRSTEEDKVAPIAEANGKLGGEADGPVETVAVGGEETPEASLETVEDKAAEPEPESDASPVVSMRLQ
jgi:glutamine synthetase